MNGQVVVPIVVALLALFSGGGVVALFMIPAQRRQLAAGATFQITQSSVLYAQELKKDLESLRTRVNELNDSLDREIERRRLAETQQRQAEEQLAVWQARFPHPGAPGPRPGRPGGDPQ